MLDRFSKLSSSPAENTVIYHMLGAHLFLRPQRTIYVCGNTFHGAESFNWPNYFPKHVAVIHIMKILSCSMEKNRNISSNVYLILA